MKIIQINSVENTGGAAKIAWRLKEGIKSKGHVCKMFVGEKRTNDQDVYLIDSMPDSNLNQIMDMQGLLYYNIDSTFSLVNNEEIISSDILHFHNLHGAYFNPFALPILTRLKPSIWTLHDMQSFTGHCAHSFDCDKWKIGCGDCPDLTIYPAIPRDSTAELWRDKKRIYDLTEITIVVPSLWLKDKVERSILRDKAVELIYNGVDTNVLKPHPKEYARERLGLSKKEIILAFSAHGGMDSVWRDGKCLKESIEYLSKKNRAILFLNIGSETNSFGVMNTLNIPYTHDERLLSLIYSSADLFLYPSLADNCPLSILEAMASGLPVVTYNTGGIPEIVKDGKTGVVVDYKDVKEFIRQTEKLIGDPERLNQYSNESVRRIRTEFSLDKMIDKYLHLYKRVVSKELGDINRRTNISVNIGDLSTQHQKYQGTDEEYSETASSESKDKELEANILILRAGLYSQQARFKEAEEELKKVISLKLQNKNIKANVLSLFGDICSQQQRYQEAEEKYKEVISLDPWDKNLRCRALVQIKALYSQQGKHKEVDEVYKKILSTGPKEKRMIILISYNLGSNYERIGELYKAKELFEDVIRFANEFPFSTDKNRFVGGAHFHLGCIYQTLGENERAKIEFQNCLKFIPDHKKAKELVSFVKR